MTDVSNLDNLAAAIATGSAKIRNYAKAQAAATQAQEADIQSRAKAPDLAALDTRAFISPKFYGAVGDGVADDTTALQAAVNAAAVAGRAVWIDKHLVSSTITVPSGVHLVGAGPGSAIYPDGDVPKGEALGSVIRASGALDPVVKFDDTKGSGMRGVCVDGSGSAITCLESGGWENYFDHCEFKDSTTYGVKFVLAEGHEQHMTNCIVSMNAQGTCLYARASDSAFIGNYFRGGTVACVHFDRSAGNMFIGNHLYPWPAVGGSCGLLLEGGQYNTIIGNYIDDFTAGPSIKIVAYPPWVPSFNNTITANVFWVTADMPDNTHPAIYIDNDNGSEVPAVWGTVISNNTFESEDTTTRWTSIVHNDGQYSSIILTGNRLAFGSAIYTGTRPNVMRNNQVASDWNDIDALWDSNLINARVTGAGSQTTAAFTHRLAGTPRVAVVTPTNANARGTSYYVTKSSTQVTLNFAAALTNGQAYTFDISAEL